MPACHLYFWNAGSFASIPVTLHAEFRFRNDTYPIFLGVQFMFGMNKKTKLEAKYKKLSEESYQLSHSNRQKSDQKLAEAEEIRKQIDALENSAES